MYQPLKCLGERTDHNVWLPAAEGRMFDGVSDQAIAELELDVIVGQRLCGPEGLALWRRWHPQVALVYELDDDVLRPPPSLPQWYGMGGSVRSMLRAADLVTCSTEPLAERLRPWNPNVAVLSNHVHEDLLAIERPRNQLLTIGWAGSFTHDAD